VSVTAVGVGSAASQSAMMYRTAVRTAVFNDGEIDAKEREFLDGIKLGFGVDEGTASALEREMMEEYAKFKLSTPVVCPGCRQVVTRGWKHCSTCGSKL
jgi:hypothetical protein